MPTGYSGLTPDQLNLVNQQGWAPRPDMVLPAGQSLQQPQGYSNLTPAQAATVGGLGYYTNPDAQQSSGSLFNQVMKALDSPGAAKGIENLQKAFAAPQPLGTAPASPLPHYPGALNYNPGHYAYTHASLDPKLALQTLMRGY